MDKTTEVTASLRLIISSIGAALGEVHKISTHNQPIPNEINALWNALDKADLIARRILQ